MLIGPSKRFQYTHNLIISTFIAKLGTKDLKSISVTDIVQEIKIHRGTFYLHFETKQDLVEEVQNTFLENLNKQSQGFFEKNTLQIDILLINLTSLLEYYLENRSVFLSFIKNSSHFVDTLKYIFLKNLNRLYDYGKVDFPDDKMNYLLTYIFSAHLGIVEEWLKHDLSTPPEEIALIIVSLTKKCLNL